MSMKRILTVTLLLGYHIYSQNSYAVAPEDAASPQPRLAETFNTMRNILKPLTDLESWMEVNQDRIGSKALKDLVIPGTHDSITSTISWNSVIARNQDLPRGLMVFGPIVPSIAAPWSKAQGKTAAEQLRLGIRYLDMRIVYRDSHKTFYTCHGLYGENLDLVLDDIREFIKTHPKEVIILDFNHLYNMEPEDQPDRNPLLINKIRKAFGDKIASREEFNPSSTLNELWSKGKQIIPIYYNDKGGSNRGSNWTKQNPWLWTANDIVSPWPNKQDTGDLKAALENNATREATSRRNRFSVLQCILTPDGNVMVGGPIRGIRSLKDLAIEPKRMLMDNLLQWVQDPTKKVNIIITDYLQEPSIIQTIIGMNLLENR